MSIDFSGFDSLGTENHKVISGWNRAKRGARKSFFPERGHRYFGIGKNYLNTVF